jgi:hypothetical protein
LVGGALLLAGCSGSGSDAFNSENAEQWFKKPFTNFQARDSGVRVADTSLRPTTPEDYVDGSGRCATPAAAPQPVNAEGAPVGDAAAGGPTVAGGVALLMTECEVVARAGTPERVDLGANPAGERTTVLTYMRGPWPGIYRFTAGRLSEIDRVAEPEQPKAKPAPKKKPSPRPALRQ